MSIWEWRNLLPEIPGEHQISLGEGNTPLIRSRRIGPTASMRDLRFKLEIANPSGSYKDRFAAAAVSHMLAQGQTCCVATSSGNTGSALAAYCAAAFIQCRIAIVETAPAGKLVQMMAYGAKLFRVERFGLDPAVTERVFETLEELASVPHAALQISAFKYSPLGMAGVQTISYELLQQANRATDVFVPAGGGGLTLAVARGFQQMVNRGQLHRSPRIHCVQPVGNATIAAPLRDGAERAVDVQCTSAISGLQVPNVIDGHEVIAICRATGGTGHLVADRDVFAVQKRLTREEGIFCEPAGAVALAGALSAAKHGQLAKDAVVVCLVTGNGFKDLTAAESMAGELPRTIAWDQLHQSFMT